MTPRLLTVPPRVGAARHAGGRRLLRLVLGALVGFALLLGGACGRAERGPCREACARMAEIAFAAGFSERLRDLPERERAVAAASLENAWLRARDRELPAVLEVCAAACEGRAAAAHTSCIAKARGLIDAERCLLPAPSGAR